MLVTFDIKNDINMNLQNIDKITLNQYSSQGAKKPVNIFLLLESRTISITNTNKLFTWY